MGKYSMLILRAFLTCIHAAIVILAMFIIVTIVIKVILNEEYSIVNVLICNIFTLWSTFVSKNECVVFNSNHISHGISGEFIHLVNIAPLSKRNIPQRNEVQRRDHRCVLWRSYWSRLHGKRWMHFLFPSCA